MALPKCPRQDKTYKKLWKKYVSRIIDRENYNESHLDQLTIFIDLLIDYETLTEFVKIHGFSFMSDGRYGAVSKPHAEVALRQQTVREIRQYAKQLDIVLTKDTSSADDGDDDDW